MANNLDHQRRNDYTHGFDFVPEAVLQLRGQAGRTRQVDDARVRSRAQVSVATAGGAAIPLTGAHE
jgi:hypothetical protein